jgi:hypothetical protein
MDRKKNNKSIKKVKTTRSFRVSFSDCSFVSDLGLDFRGNGRHNRWEEGR